MKNLNIIRKFYKNDPFAKIKGRIPAEALSKMPGQDKTIGEVFKEQEKWLKTLWIQITIILKFKQLRQT